MALKSVVLLGSINLHLGWKDLGSKPSGFPSNWINGSEEACKWVRFGGFSACPAIRSVEGGNTSKQDTDLQRVVDKTENDISKRLQKDSSSFPSGSTYSNSSIYMFS